MSQIHDNTYTSPQPNGRAERKPGQKAEATPKSTDTSGKAEQAKRQAKQKAARMKSEAKDKAQVKQHQAKGKAEQAKIAIKEKTEQVKDDPRVRRARALAEEKSQEMRSFAYEQARARQAQAAVRVSNVASAMRAAGRDLSEKDAPMAEYADLAGDKADDLAQYLSERDPEQLMRQAEAGARNNPALFIGGAFALGVLGGRFLKAGATRRNGAVIAASDAAEAQLPLRTSTTWEGDNGYR